MDLKNKIAIIIGATGGIGRELVKELDNEGVKLILISKSREELQSLIKNLKGKNNSYFACDLSDQEVTQKLASDLAGKFKTIDFLINAAGIGVYKRIEDILLKDWKDSININITSQFLFIKELAKSLKLAENSLVLTIGSGAGVIPMAGRSAYCMTKFAVRGLNLSLAEEFKNTNTHFCLITLGSTLTSFGPMSLEEKKKEMDLGKAYFTPDWVAKKLMEIIKNNKREVEYTLYPGDYGLGTWAPPTV